MVGEADGVAVLILLNHLNVQSVVDEQSGIVTVQVGHGGLGVVAENAQSGGLGIDVHSPVRAHKALGRGIVASGHQQHLGGLGGGHVGGGVKAAVAAASDDAQGVAVVDVAQSPVARHVGQAAGDADKQVVVVRTLVHDDGDHLRHLLTGDELLGCIGAVGFAVNHAQGGEHGNGIFVHDFSPVGEIVVAHSASADDHHAEKHNRSQSQTESPLEVSHLDFLLFNFEGPGRHILRQIDG